MKVDWEIVQENEEGASDKKYVGRHDHEGAVFEQAALQKCTVAGKVFDRDEGDDKEAKTNQETDNVGGAPRLACATPLHGKKITDSGGHDGECAWQVHLEYFLFERGRLWLRGFGRAEEDDDEAGSNTTDGQVNIKAPPPAEVISENTTQERTDDGCETKHCS